VATELVAGVVAAQLHLAGVELCTVEREVLRPVVRRELRGGRQGAQVGVG
jgi:hypothetical protein